MEYLVGAALALVVCLSAGAAGFDKDRSFYPVILIVIASYYLLFAAMAESQQAFLVELVVFSAFLAVAMLGSRRWQLLVALGLIAHGLYDIAHVGLVDNPGVPSWWGEFCLSFDFVAGSYLAVLVALRRRRQQGQDVAA
ncbi:hypothetical protein EV673_2920 [Limnobacter thiooxidans]|uniref:Uncharacterized protein n=1 Tax=Limnobacter thiooxidans TaxID=131080 RepID=A0AA86IZL4_9BURK|nr:hypothetical protein EV673_2920 [Limnobacter thiooxidans]BET25013.1 hypothetical protein RGQ30_05140 [Limnobacter thiooxidans]